MNDRASGFLVDGLERLLGSREFHEKRAAIEAQVRAEHEGELEAASDDWRRRDVEDRIGREIRRRLDAVMPSPYCLWSSR